jgi:hypothetical protein
VANLAQSSPPTVPPILPRISVRLCESQLLLAKPGLIRMFESIWRTRKGQTPSPFLWPDHFLLTAADLQHKRLTGHYPREKAAKYDPVLAERVMQLVNYLYPVLHGRKRQRLRLDFIDLSICALAVRGLHRQVSHKHFNAPIPNYRPAAKRFLRLLEKLRKRAKYSAIQRVGRCQYKSIEAQWQQYACWLRTRAFGCECRNPHSSMRYFYRIKLDEVVRIEEEEELRADNYRVPDARTLRKWARNIMSNVRRGRWEGLGPRSLIETPTGRAAIQFYLRRQMVKRGQKRLDEEELRTIEDKTRRSHASCK